VFFLHCCLFHWLSASWPYGHRMVCPRTWKDSFVSHSANSTVQCNFHCPQLWGSLPLQVGVQQFISVCSEDFAFPLHVQVGLVNLVPFFSRSCFLFPRLSCSCTKKLKGSTSTATPQYSHWEFANWGTLKAVGPVSGRKCTVSNAT